MIHYNRLNLDIQEDRSSLTNHEIDIIILGVIHE